MGVANVVIGSTIVLGSTLGAAGWATPLVAQSTGAEPVAPGVLTVEGRDAYGPVLSATGDEIFFTIRRNRSGQEYLVRSVLTEHGWSEPEPLPFSGGGYDKEPALSPDGSRLFFASTRPTPSGAALEFELWVAQRADGGWSEPRHLESVGSPGYDNYPSVATNGNLYFGSDRMEGRGRIFFARWTGSGYAEPEVVRTEDGAVMTGADPYIDPRERFIIHSSTRAGGAGEGDLYLTPRSGDGWGASVNVGTKVNTPDYEYTPFVSADGQYLYFSRGWGGMWRIPVTEIDGLTALLGR